MICIAGLLGLVLFLQEKVNSIIFELFVRSINHANQRKLYAFFLKEQLII